MCHPNDLPDIILKALVQHPVCFIKDQVADPLQIQATHIHQVLQSRMEGVILSPKGRL